MNEPFPHQVQASAFLASEPGYLLAGEPGTGKTFSSILAARALGASKILVTAPSIALTNWVREFTLAGSDLNVVDAKRYPKKVKDADVVVMSSDWVRSKFAEDLFRATRFDVHVADEAHAYMNPAAARTQAAYSSKLVVGKMMFLTGTPTPKHAANLWPHLNRSAPERIDHMTYDQFVARYCIQEMKILPGMRHAQPFITGNNSETIPELQQRLKGWWLRQRKGDVLKDLPPKIYNQVELPASKADISVIESEIDPDVYDAILFAQETGDSRGLDMMSPGVSKLRRMLAKVKVRATLEYLDYVIESGVECMSVWGWHTEALHDIAAGLREKGYSAGVVTGETSPTARQAYVDAFQAGKLQFFIGQIKAAGIAITLTRSSRAVMHEETSIPSDNDQAHDRHHRIGQKDSVQIDRLILTGTIDEAFAALAERRKNEYETLSKEA